MTPAGTTRAPADRARDARSSVRGVAAALFLALLGSALVSCELSDSIEKILDEVEATPEQLVAAVYYLGSHLDELSIEDLKAIGIDTAKELVPCQAAVKDIFGDTEMSVIEQTLRCLVDLTPAAVGKLAKVVRGMDAVRLADAIEQVGVVAERFGTASDVAPALQSAAFRRQVAGSGDSDRVKDLLRRWSSDDRLPRYRLPGSYCGAECARISDGLRALATACQENRDPCPAWRRGS